MSEESLSYILQSDKLKADESEVLNAVKEWSTVNAVSLNNHCVSDSTWSRDCRVAKAWYNKQIQVTVVTSICLFCFTGGFY